MTCVGFHVKSVGKPDAGNRHVRFDERGKETGGPVLRVDTAPFLDSTPFPNTVAPPVLPAVFLPPSTRTPPHIPPPRRDAQPHRRTMGVHPSLEREIIRSWG